MREIKTFQEKDYSELSIEGTELVIYLDNDSRLYRQKESIIKNLLRKIKSGKYDHNLAPKLWMYLVDEGARAYCKDFGGTVREVFPKPIRMEVAQYLADSEYQNIQDGEWTHLESQEQPKNRKTEAGMIGGGLWSSYYGDINISFDSKGMLIKAQDVGQFDFEALRADAEASQDMALLDLMEGPLANGWEYVDPEVIGALTEAPIFTNDSGDYSELFWYPDYQITSPIDDFIEDGRVYFTREITENVKKGRKKIGEGSLDMFVGEDDKGRDIIVDPQRNGMWIVTLRDGSEVVDKLKTDSVFFIDGFLVDNGCTSVDWGEGPAAYSGESMFTSLLTDLGFEIYENEIKKKETQKEEVDEDDDHAQALIAWLKDTDYPEANAEEMDEGRGEDNTYEIFGNEYMVLTDDEADDVFKEKQEQLIDEMGTEAFNQDFIQYYIDDDKYFDDVLRDDALNSIYDDPESYSDAFDADEMVDVVTSLWDDGNADVIKWLESNDLALSDFEDEDGEADETAYNEAVKDFIDGEEPLDLFDLLNQAGEITDEMIENALNNYIERVKAEYTAIEYLTDMGLDGSQIMEALGSYIDWDEVIEAVQSSDGRGPTLSPYNGAEEEIQYEGEWYFIYRTN